MATIKIYGKMGSGGTTSWYEITGAPNTLAGYGITDASPISLQTLVASNSATWGAGGGVSLSTVTEASAAAVTSANSYTDSAVAGKAAASHTHDVSEVTNAVSTTVLAAASAAAISSANSYANNNFVPIAGGTVTGSLSVLGSLTYIDTAVAVVSAMYIDTTSSEAALRVTQKGSGDAIRVEDEANPDSTPFIVTSEGKVGVGTASPTENLTVAGTVNADAYKVTSTTINAQTGTSYALVAGDNGKVVTLDNASAITVAVPAGLGAGFSCSLIQLGAGQVSLSAGVGVTLNSYLNYTKIAGQHGGASLISYSANVFNLNGNLAS